MVVETNVQPGCLVKSFANDDWKDLYVVAAYFLWGYRVNVIPHASTWGCSAWPRLLLAGPILGFRAAREPVSVVLGFCRRRRSMNGASGLAIVAAHGLVAMGHGV